MNSMGFDYSQINTNSELPKYSSVDVQKDAPTAPKKERAGIKQHMPYFMNASKGRPNKNGHKGLGYVRKSPEEEAALFERKLAKGKSKGGDQSANPLLQPISFVKGTSTWDKDMDLSNIKMAAETKDAEDVFVQIPTEQRPEEGDDVDETQDETQATTAVEEEESVYNSTFETSAFDTSNVVSSAVSSTGESTSTAGEEVEVDEDIEINNPDSSLPSISRLNIDESNDADESLIEANLLDLSNADTSIQTVTEPNMTRDDDKVLSDEEFAASDDKIISDKDSIANDDLFIIDSKPSEIPDSLKPKDEATAIVLDERVENNDDVDIEANPHHSFSRSEIVEVEEPVLSNVPETKNSKMFKAMQNDNLFKNVQQLGQMFASGNKPSFEDFTFSPNFNKKDKKKNKKNKNKISPEEPLEPRVGDSDLEWGSDGPPEPKNNQSKKTSKPKKQTIDDAIVADWLENSRQNDSDDDDSGGEAAAGPFGADDSALRSFVDNMSRNQNSITDLKIDKRLRKEAVEEEEWDDGSSVDSVEFDSEFEKEENFKFGFSDNDSVDVDIDDNEIDLDSSLSSEEAYELGRARAKAAKKEGIVTERSRKGKGKKKADDFHDFDKLLEFDDFEGKHNKWDEEEQYLDELAAIIENKRQDIQKARSSSSRQASRQGKYSYDDYGDVYGDDSEDDFAIDPSDIIFPTSSKKKKSKVPPQLQRLWDQDRVRKAEKKKVREQIRMADALSPYTKTKGKKPKKMQARAIKAAAELSDDDFLPDYYNVQTINTEIQSFVDVPQRKMMKLPPMDNKSRKQIHMLAETYNLKSKSTGKGVGRHIMLLRTARSGKNIDYAAVNKAAKACDKGGIGNFYKTLHLARKAAQVERKSGQAAKPKMMPHREGTIVGHEAKPIGQESVGYKLLAMMGWNHGQKMGQSGEGLEAPVAAVIKNSRLGLGAS
ncbi:hypothetical protein E3Q12_01537 [Wallemia mellicola]|nr:hypothetical protein E3Q12_01537 [Wallemia mellicola]